METLPTDRQTLSSSLKQGTETAQNWLKPTQTIRKSSIAPKQSQFRQIHPSSDWGIKFPSQTIPASPQLESKSGNSPVKSALNQCTRSLTTRKNEPLSKDPPQNRNPRNHENSPQTPKTPKPAENPDATSPTPNQPTSPNPKLPIP